MQVCGLNSLVDYLNVKRPLHFFWTGRKRDNEEWDLNRKCPFKSETFLGFWDIKGVTLRRVILPRLRLS